MLYFELNACEFRERNVFFFVEQAIKNNSNPAMVMYLSKLVFNGRTVLFLKLLKTEFSIMTGKNTFLFGIVKIIV